VVINEIFCNLSGCLVWLANKPWYQCNTCIHPHHLIRVAVDSLSLRSFVRNPSPFHWPFVAGDGICKYNPLIKSQLIVRMPTKLIRFVIVRMPTKLLGLLIVQMPTELINFVNSIEFCINSYFTKHHFQQHFYSTHN